MLEIRPGFGARTPIVLRGEGHDSVERVSSNLVFKIVEEKHGQYERKGNDLIYVMEISLINALRSESL